MREDKELASRNYPSADAQERSPTAPYIEALTEAWWELKEAVGFQAFCLYDGGADEHERRLPYVYAWLCAPWKPLAYRFSRHNLERLLRPLKAERRQRAHDMCDYVFWCGDDRGDEWWAEAGALVAEFGIDFPPRGYEPMSVAQLVGQQMGMSSERIAEIEAEVRAA